MKITAKHFEKSVGCKPQDDDLTRSNCKETGLMHSMCGWDIDRDMPNFIPGKAHYLKSRKVTTSTGQAVKVIIERAKTDTQKIKKVLDFVKGLLDGDTNQAHDLIVNHGEEMQGILEELNRTKAVVKKQTVKG